MSTSQSRIAFRKPDLVLQLARDAVTCLDDTEQFQVTGTEKWIRFDYDVDALIEQTNLRDLMRSIHVSYPEVIIRNALVSLKKAGPFDTASLKHEVEAEVGKARGGPSDAWRFIFPINVEPPTRPTLSKRSFTIMGHQVTWFLWGRFSNRYLAKIPEPEWKWINLRTIWSKEESYLTGYSFLEVTASARDMSYAFELASRIAETFIAIVHLSMHWDRTRIHIGPEQAFSKIVPPRGVLIFDGKGQYSGFEATGDLPREVPRMKDWQMKRLEWFHRRHRTAWNSALRHVIGDSMTLYSAALTETSTAFAFLRLWMALERMTLMKGFKAAKIIGRLSSLFTVPYSFHAPLMMSLLSKRHRLVHEGDVTPIIGSDLNYVKILCESALSVLFKQAELKRSMHQLNIILELAGRPDNEIRDYSRISRGLLRTKKTSNLMPVN